MPLHAQILGWHRLAVAPSLQIFADGPRFLFNAGENVQRFHLEHKLHLSRTTDIFLTSVSTTTVGGLPGLLLTLEGAGTNTVRLWGPPAVRDFIEMACASFAGLRGIDIEYHILSPIREKPSQPSSSPSSPSSPASVSSHASHLTSACRDVAGANRNQSATDCANLHQDATAANSNNKGTKEQSPQRRAAGNDGGSTAVDGSASSTPERTGLQGKMSSGNGGAAATLGEYSLPSGLTVSALLLPHSRRWERLNSSSNRWWRDFLTGRRKGKDKMGKFGEHTAGTLSTSSEQHFASSCLESECGGVGQHEHSENPLLSGEELSGRGEHVGEDFEGTHSGTSPESVRQSRKTPLSAKDNHEAMLSEDDRDKKKKRACPSPQLSNESVVDPSTAPTKGLLACAPNRTALDTQGGDCQANHQARCNDDMNDCVVYVLRSPDVRGRFHPEKAKKLGVPVGPLFGRLKNGEAIKLPSGETVKPEDVCDAVEPGQTIIVVHCVESQQAAYARNHLRVNTDTLAFVFHMTSSLQVLRSPEYKQLVQSLSGPETVHILCDQSDEAITVSPFVHAAKLRRFLHDLMPPVFPRPRELPGVSQRSSSSSPPANDKNSAESLEAFWGVEAILRPASMTRFDISSFSKRRVDDSSSLRSFFPQFSQQRLGKLTRLENVRGRCHELLCVAAPPTASNSCDDAKICSVRGSGDKEGPGDGFGSSSHPASAESKSDGVKGELDSTLTACDTGTPRAERSTSSAGGKVDEACFGVPHKDLDLLDSIAANGIQHAKEEDFSGMLQELPAVLLLGTGAAAPSQYRNVSGMVLSVRQDFGKGV
ncbi:ribonuclease z [Cystoisospora suis]|uniref:ribonuclease Z n=1 Tax=Cystoisospora suis TaxID=483139 RepID=A0A2C6LH59_9APIC|nr:ribonuclease z [Cystoisospora suis]